MWTREELELLRASRGEGRNMEDVEASQTAPLVIPARKSHNGCVNLTAEGRGGDQEDQDDEDPVCVHGKILSSLRDGTRPFLLADFYQLLLRNAPVKQCLVHMWIWND